jgi:hypothetical protein
MASGRLGSALLQPVTASLLYSNTSGSPAAVNIQATSLNTTTNAKFSYAIDSATVAVNQTTVNTTISAGNIDYKIYWLDPKGNANPIRHNFTSQNGYQSGGATYHAAYWDGSAWANGGLSIFYGNWLPVKLDPYFLTNFSEYNNKTSPTFIFPTHSTSADNIKGNLYNLNSMTALQLSQTLSTGYKTAATTLKDYGNSNIYGGFGVDVDIYQDWLVGVNGNGYINIWSSANSDYEGVANRTTDSFFYNQFLGGGTMASNTHNWYAPRVIASNGFCLFQPTGTSSSYFTICDVETGISTNNTTNIFYQNTIGLYTLFSGPSTSLTQVSWFEWNPNTSKFYLEYIGTSGKNEIWSFTKAGLRTARKGSSQAFNFIDAGGTREARNTPWGQNFALRPQRIGTSLWQTQSANGQTYVSTDLVNWTVSSTYWTTQGLPSGTTCFNPISTTSYLYAGSGIANINKFNSNYSTVAQTAVIENQTSFSNYQRTGLVLNNGDKLYCQNFGTVPYSITAMGYEG